MWSATDRQRDLARRRSTRTVIPARGAGDERHYPNGRAARLAATLMCTQGPAPRARTVIAGRASAARPWSSKSWAHAG
jgi:hypothetical protein